MQFSYAALAASLVAYAAAGYPVSNSTASAVWVTDVVDVYTTVCPFATTFAANGITYIATESETITITNCPCTVSKLTTPSAPAAPFVFVNATSAGAAATPAPPAAKVQPSAAAPTTVNPAAAVFTGAAANNVVVGSTVSLAGLLGLVAYIL